MLEVYDEDIKEKKLIVRSSKKKSSSKKSKRHMFPIDFMDNRQKKEYIKGGNVVVSNLYDELLTLEEYQKLPDEQKKAAMEHWRKSLNTATIKRTFKWNDYKIYKEFNRLGIAVKTINRKKNNARKNAVINAKQSNDETAVAVKTLPAFKSGLSFFLYEECDSEELVSKMMKYATFLEGEKNKFRIRMEIEEVKP